MEGREEGGKGLWNCDKDPASSCLGVKIEGERHENDKSSSVNIKSSLVADVCTDNFIQPLLTPAPFVYFLIWLFISSSTDSQRVIYFLSACVCVCLCGHRQYMKCIYGPLYSSSDTFTCT